jgi:hypothetical protein
MTLDELHRAAELLAENLRPLGMTLVRGNLWHLADDPTALSSKERRALGAAERLRYGLRPFEETVLYEIATGTMTHEPKGRDRRVALASLIDQCLVGDHDAHGYAIHTDVAYSLALSARPLRSSIRRANRTPPRPYRTPSDRDAANDAPPRLLRHDRIRDVGTATYTT